jgi:hypothetical protein
MFRQTQRVRGSSTSPKAMPTGGSSFNSGRRHVGWSLKPGEPIRVRDCMRVCFMLNILGATVMRVRRSPQSIPGQIEQVHEGPIRQITPDPRLRCSAEEFRHVCTAENSLRSASLSSPRLRVATPRQPIPATAGGAGDRTPGPMPQFRSAASPDVRETRGGEGRRKNRKGATHL